MDMNNSENSNEVKLRLLGITYNQIESGVYALVLQEEEGQRRIPIVIGYAEAQAIECKLQEVRTPRPLTHDLLAVLIRAFGGRLEKVVIHRLPNGVFAGNLFLTAADGNRMVIDSRSSDAIALAIRVNAPIFTTRTVIDEVGFTTEEDRRGGRIPVRTPSVADASRPTETAPGPESYSDEELKCKIDECVEREDYELANELMKILNSRKTR